MSEEKPPERIAVIWSPQARECVRTIEPETALQVVYCIDRYLGEPRQRREEAEAALFGFRLRCGDYRVFFDFQDEDNIEITGLRIDNAPSRSSAAHRAGFCLTAAFRVKCSD